MRTVYRRNPVTSLMNSYVLTVADYDRLVASGINLETVSESDLFEMSERYSKFDSFGRVVMIVELPHEAQVQY